MASASAMTSSTSSGCWSVKYAPIGSPGGGAEPACAAPRRTGITPPGRPARPSALPVRGGPGGAALRFPSHLRGTLGRGTVLPGRATVTRKRPTFERHTSCTGQRRRGHEGGRALRQRSRVRAGKQSCDPAAISAAAEQPRQRQQRRGLVAERAERRLRLNAEHARAVAAGVAALDMTRQPVLLGATVGALHHAHERRPHGLAAAAVRDLLVLALQPAAGAEERAFHGRPREVQLRADLAIRHALELAHDEHLRMHVRELVERALEVAEPLLRDQRGVGAAVEAHEAAAVRGAEALVRVHRDLHRVAGAAVAVDRRVAGDLKDPRLEVDLGIRGAHALERRHERLFGDVLAASLVAQHSADECGDSLVIAPIELLERRVVSGTDGGYEISVGGLGSCCGDHECIPAEGFTASRARPPKAGILNIVCHKWRSWQTSLRTWTISWPLPSSRTPAQMAFRCRVRRGLTRLSPASRRIASCSSGRRRRARTSYWPTTGCSGTSTRARSRPR